MTNLRDKLWIWGHAAGSHDTGWNTPAPSRMTPVEGAYYLGVPNLIMVRYEGRPEPPYAQYARAFRPLGQFVWSIVGARGETSDAEIAAAGQLAAAHPNMTGVMMDDFFQDDPQNPGVYSPQRLGEIRGLLAADRPKPLDLWVVLYQHQLDLPVADHLALCDVATYWTWRAELLPNLEKDFARFEEIASSARKVLGLYMWDYGDKKALPLDLMQHQCELGLQWLNEGRVEGLIFLASCICDIELDAVEWSRQWIAEQF